MPFVVFVRRSSLRWFLVISLPLWFCGLGTASPLFISTVDRVLVEKKERRLALLANGQEVRAYRVALGPNPEGPKATKGDMRTPEGVYFIVGRNEQSRYHRALRISYPSPADTARARALGVSPGGDIMIHGLPEGRGEMAGLHPDFNWTRGCIAVTNEEIEEIWRLVPDGTPIEIRP